jgi:putative transposase
MARRHRFFLEGVPLHVIFRGNERQAIFRREGDRHYFRDLLVEGVRKRGIQVHAYVFMTNHVHLLATPSTKESFPGLFRSLGASYVHYFNKYCERSGHLWEDRYKSLYVHDGPHLLGCMRYVELNPVRAGMVDEAGAFAWSSYRANAWGREDDLVTPHSTFLQLGSSPGLHAAAYRALFDPVIDQQISVRIRAAIQDGWAYGDDAFVLRTGKEMGLTRKLDQWLERATAFQEAALKLAA